MLLQYLYTNALFICGFNAFQWKTHKSRGSLISNYLSTAHCMIFIYLRNLRSSKQPFDSIICASAYFTYSMNQEKVKDETVFPALNFFTFSFF